MMKTYLIPLLLILSIPAVSNAGYVNYDQTSYTSNIYMNVDEGSGSTEVGTGDIIRSVQFFSYTDTAGATRYATALSFMQVTAYDGTNKKYTFETVSTPNVARSLSTFLSSNSYSTAGMENTADAGSVDGLDFVLMSRSTAFSSSDFNWNSADFGLGSGWVVDATAGLVSSSTFLYEGGYYTPSSAGLDTKYPGVTPGPGNGETSTMSGVFGFTINAIRDTVDDKYAGTALSNFTTVNAYDIRYGTITGTSPTGSNFYATGVAVSMPNINTIPEPSTLLVVSALGLVGLSSRRRRR